VNAGNWIQVRIMAADPEGSGRATPAVKISMRSTGKLPAFSFTCGWVDKSREFRSCVHLPERDLPLFVGLLANAYMVVEESKKTVVGAFEEAPARTVVPKGPVKSSTLRVSLGELAKVQLTPTKPGE
jgi:hypothetical protein